MKKVIMLLSALLAISLMVTVVPFNVESQDVGPTSYIKGVVYDAVTKEPLEEALVRLFSGVGGEAVWTDEEGYYEFELNNLISEEFDILASHRGHYDQWESGEVGRDETVEIDFFLEPIPTMVEGYVTDSETGDPLVWAYVEMYSTNVDGMDYYARTDEEGYYQIHADPGDYKLSARFEGYQIYESGEFSLSEGDEMMMNITLELIPTGVFGVVMNEDGEALGGAYIRIYQEQGQRFFESTFADRQGNYEIRAPPGEYIIQVSYDEHFDYEDSIIIPQDGMLEYDVEMTPITITGVLQYIVDMIMEMIGGIF